MRKAPLFVLLFLSALFASAQSQINPATQINWPDVTGSGAPTSTCDSTTYGEPYTDVANNKQYACGFGWFQIGGTNGTVTRFDTGTWPNWLTPVVTNNTTTPSLGVVASPIPYSALDSATVPTWNQSTTGNAATATQLSTTGNNGTVWGVSSGGSQGWQTLPTFSFPAAGITTSTGTAWGTPITPSAGYLHYTGTAYEWLSSTQTWPSGSAGIPNYNGSNGWGTSYSNTNPIPANFISTLNQNTTGNAATATKISTIGTAGQFWGTNDGVNQGWFTAGLSSFTSGNLTPLFSTSLGANPTTAPVLSFSLSNASANTFFAGPTSGVAAAPSYRAIVAADIPVLNQNTTGNAATATNISTNGTSGQAWGMTNGTTQGWITTGLSSFTSGNLSPLFTSSLGGSPTTAPALSFTLSNAAQNAVFAGPASGGAGAPSYRALVAADIPTLNQSTTGNAATASAIQTNGIANQVWGMDGTGTTQGWQTFSGGGMVYPGAGIPLSTGSSWASSLGYGSSTGFLYDNAGSLSWQTGSLATPLSFVRDEGAVGDAIHINNCAITSGSTTIPCSSAVIPASYVGKTVAIAYAGTTGTHSIGNTLISTVSSVSGCTGTPSMCTTMVIADAPSLSISGPTTYTCSATSGSFTLTSCTGGTLTAGDIGKGENGSIVVAGIGPNVGYGTTTIEPLTIYIDGIPSSSSITMNKMSLQTAASVSVTLPGTAIVIGTNNASQLQAGVNAACSTGRPLSVDPGKYLIAMGGSNIQLCSGAHVFGWGKYGVSVFYPADSTGHFFMVTSPTGSTLYQNLNFHDFEIDNSAYTVNSYVVGAGKLSLNQSYNVTAHDLYIHDTPATALAVDASTPAYIYNNDIRRPGKEYVLLAASGGGSAGIGNGNTPNSTIPLQNQGQFIYSNWISDPGNIGIFNESESTTTSVGWNAWGNNCSWAQTGFRQCYGDHGNMGSKWQNNISYYAITGISAEQGLASTWPSDFVMDSNICLGCNKMININIKGGGGQVTNNYGDAFSFNEGSAGYTGNFMTITCQSGATCGPLKIANNTMLNYMSIGIDLVSGTFSDVILEHNVCNNGGFYTNSPCIYQAAGTIGRLINHGNTATGTHINYGFQQASGATITEFDNSTTNNFKGVSTAELNIGGTVTTCYLNSTTCPSSGQIQIGTGSTASAQYAPQTVSGDATLTASGVLTVTKTNGTAFAASATTDTTNAANITSGTISTARMPVVPTVLDTATPVTVSTTNVSEAHFNQNATAGTAITYNLPVAAAGKQFCFANSNNGSAADIGTLTLQTSGTGQYIIFTDGTLSASGGYVISSGAAADAACVFGVDATHWQLYTQRGSWSKF